MKKKCVSENGSYTRHRWDSEKVCGRCGKKRNTPPIQTTSIESMQSHDIRIRAAAHERLRRNTNLVYYGGMFRVTWPHKSKNRTIKKITFSVVLPEGATTRIRYIDTNGGVS